MLVSTIMSMNTVLQNNIKLQLNKKNISIAELERRAGLRHAVINILRGRSKNPSIKIASAIAKELECSIEDLITEPGSNPDSHTGFSTNNDIDSNQNTVPIDSIVQTDHNFTLDNQKDSKLDLELSKEISIIIHQVLEEKKITLDINNLVNCWLEIYNYCFASPAKIADKRFIEWFITRNFNC